MRISTQLNTTARRPISAAALAACAAAAAALTVVPALASTLAQIGVTQLRQVNPSLTGAGVILGQAEASVGGATDAFEVNPANLGATASGQSRSFVYTNSSNVASSVYSSAAYSGHAEAVAQNYYGSSGVADGATTIYNYDSNAWAGTYVFSDKAPPTGLAIVNQSFIYSQLTAGTTDSVDTYYDNYTDQYNTIFVSAVGNGGSSTTYTTPSSQINAPATAYNSIAVAAYGGSSGVGTTFDGRSKPDISAPAGETSFAAPLVAGSAALLVQAGRMGIGGGSVSAETDERTVKALLLNGAVKPVGWTHTATQPLDTRWGAGVVNVYNSYTELAAGQVHATTSNTAALGSTGPAETSMAAQSHLQGWDFASITSSASANAINHYVFNLGSASNLTATLVWNRQINQANINNLDLYLYNSLGQAVAISDSSVDNVQQLYTLNLAPGKYDLEVVKLGGSSEVSSQEQYALAYSFISSSTASTPEPATLSLLVVGGTALLMRRRKPAAAKA